MKKRLLLPIIALMLIVAVSLVSCSALDGILGQLTTTEATTTAPVTTTAQVTTTAPATTTTPITTTAPVTTTPPTPDVGYVDINSIPPYTGSPFIYINGGEPEFSDGEITTKSYEFYSQLDQLGRCGVTHACLGKDLMPTESREDIGSVSPSGWRYNGKSNNNRYSTDLVEGGYVYNRCHLIGFQLAGENANEKNLITGTRYLNIEGMLTFENMIADYIKETNNHVVFRVTPIYNGDELVPRGVHMEAYSVEDEGDGICFNVYSYNVQPGIEINYQTGENWLSDEQPPENNDNIVTVAPSQNQATYILNTNSKKVHKETCRYATDINEANKQVYTGYLQDLINNGYTACGTCDPT